LEAGLACKELKI